MLMKIKEGKPYFTTTPSFLFLLFEKELDITQCVLKEPRGCPRRR
jgi:hypothetical protein